MQTKTRREREREQKKRDILDAAQVLFAEKGFHGTTMAEISQASEFPLGTIYKFFQGKEQLYHDLIVERGRAFGRILNRSLRDETLSPKAKLAGMMNDIADYFVDNKAFIRLYISQVIHVDAVLMPELGRNISRMHDEMISLYAGLMASGMASGDFVSAEPDELAELFQGMITSTFWAWIQAEEPADRLSERLQTIYTLIAKDRRS
ncbi:MAG: TetR family transcriptional regulator [Deltaproteobacteria bacterium]|nr:MAG: TetR family transcriptional regulator [Deltaproteobacteria bacterium]